MKNNNFVDRVYSSSGKPARHSVLTTNSVKLNTKISRFISRLRVPTRVTLFASVTLLLPLTAFSGLRIAAGDVGRADL